MTLDQTATAPSPAALGSAVDEPVAGTGTSAQAPINQAGALRGQVWLTLQTRHAERLVKGRRAAAEKPAIVGLIGYANLLRAIWHGARGDDPYADWWLVRVEEALAEAREALDRARTGLAGRVDATAGIELVAPTSVQPIRVALQFSNPYAYQGARLLASFDGFAREVLAARHVGALVRDDAERLLQEGARPVRRAFASALGYRFLGVTRDDLRQGTARAAQARAAMGEVPAEILTGTRRASLAPRRGGFSPNGLSQLALSPLPGST